MVAASTRLRITRVSPTNARHSWWRTGSEPDASKRKRISSELNDIVINESFIIALASFLARLVVSNRVHEVQSPDATRLDNSAYTDAWLG